MGAVVGGIEACYDSGPPPGGYPFVAGTVGMDRVGDQNTTQTLAATGTAAANADFVVYVAPGDYELFAYDSSDPAVPVTVSSGHITFQDLRSDGGCI